MQAWSPSQSCGSAHDRRMVRVGLIIVTVTTLRSVGHCVARQFETRGWKDIIRKAPGACWRCAIHRLVPVVLRHQLQGVA